MRIIVLIAVLLAVIGLQIFLSTRKNKWFGLILPILSLLLAVLIVPLNMMAPAGGLDMSFIVTMLVAFVIYNIPTILYMVIYNIFRKSKAK